MQIYVPLLQHLWRLNGLAKGLSADTPEGQDVHWVPINDSGGLGLRSQAAWYTGSKLPSTRDTALAASIRGTSNFSGSFHSQPVFKLTEH